jgi:hypothetical protein
MTTVTLRREDPEDPWMPSMADGQLEPEWDSEDSNAYQDGYEAGKPTPGPASRTTTAAGPGRDARGTGTATRIGLAGLEPARMALAFQQVAGRKRHPSLAAQT